MVGEMVLHQQKQIFGPVSRDLPESQHAELPEDEHGNPQRSGAVCRRAQTPESPLFRTASGRQARENCRDFRCRRNSIVSVSPHSAPPAPPRNLCDLLLGTCLQRGKVFVGIDPDHGLILERSRSRRFVLRSRRDAPARRPTRWPGPQLSRSDSTPATGLHWPRVSWPEPATRPGPVYARCGVRPYRPRHWSRFQGMHHPVPARPGPSPAQLREERFDIPKRAHDEAYPW